MTARQDHLCGYFKALQVRKSTADCAFNFVGSNLLAARCTGVGLIPMTSAGFTKPLLIAYFLSHWVYKARFVKSFAAGVTHKQTSFFEARTANVVADKLQTARLDVFIISRLHKLGIV